MIEKLIAFRLNEVQLKKLDALALSTGTDRSVVLRQLVDGATVRTVLTSESLVPTKRKPVQVPHE